ncbi:CHAP domain-containing protein [Chryseobacterium sp. SNU WT5]|uniref:CHAP domain-containing protein n=1 Tax=Chryseobacterium sp. SNU WT5 TaxID=2594269 RepID=UPI00117D7F06|nr:CHAP domain-containing protein [Chryseobacterium sp. SNU WT5]QDP84105.1 CHAP domain-containing protein [Chryseobacterium sp. SNU WT5]
MKIKKYFTFLIFLALFMVLLSYVFKRFNFNSNLEVGEKIDSLNGVYVHHNGGVSHILERNRTKDGYNLGMKYQCVEFVKRYYYETYKHKMPDAFGNAKDFFDPKLMDGEFNNTRGLLQFTNASSSKPQVGDLLIYSPTILNKFGHVSIISKVTDDQIEIIQQNPGPFSSSREHFILIRSNNKWKINNSRIVGWLRKDLSEA